MANKLNGSRVYLAGPMDHAPDGGVGWRRDIGEFLRAKGVTILDPTNKALMNTSHQAALNEDIEFSTRLRREERWIELAAFAKEIRHVDLRMVDISDFLVVYINTEIKMCGTWEELFTSNRQKKPILVVVEGGLANCPLWIFGTIPLEYIFESFEQVRERLDNLDTGRLDMDGRWTLLDHDKLEAEQCMK